MSFVGDKSALELSFIIVNWNTKDLTLAALRSIVDTAGGYRHEVFVVDNGSTDGSPEAILKAYPHVSLISNKCNVGFARGVNQALEQVKGRYIVLLNSDARLTKGAVEAFVNFMEENPDVGITGGQLLNEDGTKQNSIAPRPTLATELTNKRLLRLFFPRRYPGKEKSYASPIEVESLVGACLCVRHEAIEEVGGLDEGYFFFLEETDWCLRMRERGWRVVFVPAATIFHLQGQSAAAARAEAKIEFYRSRYRFFSKWYGERVAQILRVGLVVRLLCEVIANGLLFWHRGHRKRWSTYWLLLLWHLRGCPADQGLCEVSHAAKDK